MDALLKRRSTTKGSITRLEKWYTTNHDTVVNVYEYESRLDGLKKAFSVYCDLQEQIEAHNPEQETDRDTMEDKYYSLTALFSTKINELKSCPANMVAPSVIVQPPATSHVNKPQLNIPPFSGSLVEWKSFYQLFEALIEKDSALSDIEKLVYLRSYVTGEPLNLISNLKIIDTNFQVALTTLKERYANELNIIYSHIKSLLNIQSIQKCNAPNLRNFIISVKQNCDGLKNLQVDVESWNLLLVYILSEKLDNGTRRAFDFELKVGDRPTLKQFLQFLDTRCTNLERSMIPDINSSARHGLKSQQLIHFTHSNSQDPSVGQTSSFSNNPHPRVSLSVQCLFCGSSGHKIYKCSEFSSMSHSNKINFIKQQKLCFNCLASQHQIKDCQSKGCFVCNRKHHTLLHQDDLISIANSNYQNTHSQGQARFQNSSFSPRTPTQFNTRSQNTSQQSQQVSRSNTRQFHGSPLRNPHSIIQNSQLSRTPSNPNNQIIANNRQEISAPETQITHTIVSPQNTNSNSDTILSTMSDKNEVLLATAMVKLFSTNNEPVYARALLDSCSTTSLVTNDLVQKLKLTPTNSTINISGIHGTATHSNKVVSLSIHSSVNRKVTFDISCCVLNKITNNVPQFILKKSTIRIPKNIELADPHFNIPGQVDILLGADVYYSIVFGSPERINENLLFLLNTHLGYIISGPVPISSVDFSGNTNKSCFHIQNSNSIDQLIENFWTIEHISESNNKILSPEEKLAEKIFTETIKVLDNGRLQVDLPLKTPKEYTKLGNSLNQAITRFYNLEKRFQKNPHLFSQYNDFINEYVALKHGKYVPLTTQNDRNEKKYFIPHHCVIREDSATTKLRVVFDASMKTSSGVSLNDIMLKGFLVQPELYDILCRFRSFPYVLLCDIEKMYRQIRINPKQTFLQNIVWRNNPNENLKCIELQTISYGTNSAPFLATRSIKFFADLYKKVYPLAAEVVNTQCYVDDLLCGADSLETLKETHSQLLKLFGIAQFKLHKWHSNSKEFSENLLSTQSNYEITSFDSQNKVLGLSWSPSSDTFSISLPKNIIDGTPTKRIVLSTIAQLFDPLGLIGPIIIVAKLTMQLVWVEKIDWDAELPSNILLEWKKFISDLPHLSKLKIPRHLFLRKDIARLEIHGFADASLKAYGACVYFRAVYSDQTVSCHLISSKSRVSPLKTITLPRLELCAALLLSKLTQRILQIFKDRSFTFHSINLWTDSQITLCWIHSISSRWTIFVSNRVSEIQQITAGYKWYHVKSADNPADLLSRGLTSHDLGNSKLWWHGPNFLHVPNLNLEKMSRKNSLPIEIPEQRKTVMIIQDNSLDFWQDSFSRFSSFSRLKRVFTFCKRFIYNLKNKNEKVTGSLSVAELQAAENLLVEKIQKMSFSKEISEINSKKIVSNKNILHLSPFLDKSGLLRVGGRLSKSDLPFNQKFPILLPSKNRIVSLMLKLEHNRLGHAGAQNVLSNFRLRYWPLGGLKEIKKIIRNCHTCFRFKAITSQQIMADLPLDRVCISKPFSKVGVDFGGPLSIKSSKLKRAPILKCYMAIFVCFATKAVHIELVSDLSTDAFILCLKRFISRRGNPKVIYSDNATNFQGARNQLRDLYIFFQNECNSELVSNFLSSYKIQWKFIPPRSPHWGGIWEAAVKSIKYHLNRIVGSAHLTFEELATILCQIEAILNSRPLVPISSDAQDLQCLTPGHFLIGESLTSFPEKDILSIPENRLSRWNRITQMQQQFWKRWSKEYLNLLQNKPKWLKPTRNLQVNDVVLLKDEDCKPFDWPIARVLEVMPGTDGKVRMLKIKTKNGIFCRGITKVCPLPLENN